MARDPYSAAAGGIESGFRMGLALDARDEQMRRTRFEEARETEADRRAQSDLELRTKREDREQKRLDRLEAVTAGEKTEKLLTGRREELLKAGQARAAQGLDEDPSAVKEYSEIQTKLGNLRQNSLNYWSRVQTGQVDPTQTPSKELYMNLVAATGMKPEELQQVPQYTADLQAGMESGNQGLVLQSMNKLMAPRLQKGVGAPSPYGGTVVKKEIIGLDPARDANGVDHPDKFIPRLRVYVKGDDGSVKYYDAPATKDGSTDPDAKVQAVSMKDAFDHLGQLGVLANVVQHPGIQTKLQEGAKEAGPEADKYLSEYRSLTAPNKKVQSREKLDLGDRVLERDVDISGNIVKEREYKKGAQPRVFSPSRGVSTINAKLEALNDQLDADLEAAGDDEEKRQQLLEQYKVDKRAVLTSIKPSAAAVKGPSNAEQNAAVTDAVKIAAGNLGLTYSPITKEYKNRDGTPPTPDQLSKLDSVREAAIIRVRDNAAKGKRTTGEELKDTTKPTEKKVVKWSDLPK